MKRKAWIKQPSPVLIDRIYREAKRACGAARQSSEASSYAGFLRRVHREFNRRLELAGIYVEHAGMPETQTEEWRARDRADEMREVSFITAARKAI